MAKVSERKKRPAFDPEPLFELDLDPFDVGLVAPFGAKNPYRKRSFAAQYFDKGQRAQQSKRRKGDGR